MTSTLDIEMITFLTLCLSHCTSYHVDTQNWSNQFLCLFIKLVRVDEGTSSINKRNGGENMKNQPIKHSPKMEKCIAEKMSDLLQFIDDISGWEKNGYFTVQNVKNYLCLHRQFCNKLKYVDVRIWRS